MKVGGVSSTFSLLRNIDIASERVAKSTLQLSSGKRMISAADDAAGLSVAQKLEAQSAISKEGLNNLKNGRGFVSIALSAAEYLTVIVDRVTELSSQAMNGSFSAEQRKALDLEAKALQDEYNRILASTQFNGRNVFQALAQEVGLQAGIGNESAILVNSFGVGAENLSSLWAQSITFIADSAGPEFGASAFNELGPYGDKAGSFSSNGELLAYSSDQANLVAGDANGADDIFVSSLASSSYEMVSVSSSGVQGDGDSVGASMSADGRYIVFTSRATNLVSGDTNGVDDIFLRDRVTNTTTRISTDSSGVQSNGGSFSASISPNGRYVTYISGATNLVAGDTNGVNDVFLKDLTTGQTVRMSTSSTNVQANNESFNPTFSGDSTAVVFTSSASNLAAGDTNARQDVFVKMIGSGVTTLDSVSSSGAIISSDQFGGQLVGGTRYLFFTTREPLSGDTNSSFDVFMRDRVAGTTTLITRSSSGTSGNNHSSNNDSYVSVSEDGRYVAFSSSATNLVPGVTDTNPNSDIFIKDTTTGEIRFISTRPDGTPASGATSSSPRLSADGRYISFRARGVGGLVTSDPTGSATDYYVRVNPFYADELVASQNVLREMESVSLLTSSEAGTTRDLMASYADEVGRFKGIVGAGLSRVESAKSALEVQNNNEDAAFSRIVDVDVAESAASLLRAKIMRNQSVALLGKQKLQSRRVMNFLLG
jgi:flagellin-like hook-associated protein FlgL